MSSKVNNRSFYMRVVQVDWGLKPGRVMAGCTVNSSVIPSLWLKFLLLGTVQIETDKVISKRSDQSGNSKWKAQMSPDCCKTTTTVTMRGVKTRLKKEDSQGE